MRCEIERLNCSLLKDRANKDLASAAFTSDFDSGLQLRVIYCRKRRVCEAASLDYNYRAFLHEVRRR